jgi:hypothetical protein
MVGRPRGAVVLTEDERAALLMWTRSRTCSQARALRARIVLACADEPTNTAVARRLGVSRDMVGTWRARFLAERLDGLDERPRPGRPPRPTTTPWRTSSSVPSPHRRPVPGTPGRPVPWRPRPA